MSRKIPVMDVFVEDPTCDMAELLAVYMSEFVKFDSNELEEIYNIVENYYFEMCDNILSISPGKNFNYLNNIIKTAKKLNLILNKCDSIALMQDKCRNNDEDELCSKIINYWVMPGKNFLEHSEEISNLMSRLNSILIKNNKDIDPEFLGLGLAIERVNKEMYSNAFCDLFIFNIRQLLNVLVSSLEVEANRISNPKNFSDETGAPRDVATGNFLLKIFDIYRNRSDGDGADDGYYCLIEILTNYVNDKVCKIYGDHKKIRASRLERDGIRMALCRAKGER